MTDQEAAALGGVEVDPDLGRLGPDALSITPAELQRIGMLFATPSRTAKMAWVEAYTVSWSPSHEATTPWVSSWEWVCTGQ